MYGLKSLDRLVKCHARWWLGKNKEAREIVRIYDLLDHWARCYALVVL